MIPEPVLQQLLARGEAWRVSTVDYLEAERPVLLRVAETPTVWARQPCPHGACGSGSGYDHTPPRHWRPRNVCPWESALVCALPRGPCRDGRKVFPVRTPWAGHRPPLTQAFEALALPLRRARPGAKAGAILGETEQKLGRRLLAEE